MWKFVLLMSPIRTKLTSRELIQFVVYSVHFVA